MREAVFDIECDSEDINKVNNVWCIAVKEIVDGEEQETKGFGPNEIVNGICRLQSCDRLIGHNIICYDLPVLGRHYGFHHTGLVLDTLVLSRLANPDRRMPWGMFGRPRPHSIEAWGHRIGSHKTEHNEWDKFSDAMMSRCIQDVEINWAVYKALYFEFKE